MRLLQSVRSASLSIAAARVGVKYPLNTTNPASIVCDGVRVTAELKSYRREVSAVSGFRGLHKAGVHESGDRRS